MIVLFFIITIAALFPPLSCAEIDPAPGLMKAYQAAEYSFQQGDYEKTLLELRRIGSLAEEQRLLRIEQRCLRLEGLTLWNLGRVSDSKVSFEKALKLSQGSAEIEIISFSRAALKIIALYQEAKEDRGNLCFAQSTDKFHQAILLAEQLGCDHLKTKCLRQVSLILIDTGKYSEFRQLMQTIIQIAKWTHNHRELSYSFINYGLFFVVNNDYIKALSCFQKAYEIALKYCEASIQADCLNNIGVCYQYLGDYDRAIASIYKAIPLIKNPSNSARIIDYLINLGASVARSANRRNSEREFSIADGYLHKGLALATTQKLEISEVNALINLGFLNELRGYDVDAYRYYVEASRKELGEAAFEQQAIIFCNIGNIHRKLGDVGSALCHYTRAEKIAATHSFNHILWEIYLGQGLCLRKAGRTKSSIYRLKKAIDIIESIKEINGRNPEIVLSLDDKRDAYSALIEALMERRDSEEAKRNIEEIFDYMERANSRRQNDPPRPGEDDALADNRRDNNLTRREAQVTMAGARDALIDNKTAIIEYCVGKKNSFMLCIRRSGGEIYRIDGTRQIKDSLNGYLRAISIPGDKFSWYKAGERISFELLPNIKELWNSGIKHLVVVPDNILYLIPFEALCYKNQFLIERFSISYSPSASTLVNLAVDVEKKGEMKEYLGIGTEKTTLKPIETLDLISKTPIDSTLSYYNYFIDGYPRLPYCRDEIRHAYELFDKTNADILLGAEATEANAKNRVNNKYKIVHFACHGILGVEDPLNSALVLIGDPIGKEDGFLQAKEIVNMRIEADLVLLSACESGLEAGAIGYGVMGMSKAFLKSGAKSVVSTLWKINDRATSIFIKYLFDKLLAGYSINEALRYAKLKMTSTRYSHPYYWAAFILNGDYKSNPFKASTRGDE